MPELKHYPTSADLPPLLKQQIIDFLRMFYPLGFVGDNQLRDWTSTPDNHPAHLVIVEGERLISHTEIVWKTITHNGVRYRAYGLSGVLTYPEFQRQGYGAQVVRAATEFVLQTDADIALFHCDHDLKPFYTLAGWIPMERAVTLVGPPENPAPSDELLMMRFLSELGKRGRADFETIPFYFGNYTW